MGNSAKTLLGRGNVVATSSKHQFVSDEKTYADYRPIQIFS